MKMKYIEDLDFFEEHAVHEYPHLTDGKEYEVKDKTVSDKEISYLITDDSGESMCYSTDLFVPILYTCSCCGRKTLETYNEFEICETCFWEDDPLQREGSDDDLGANTLSLNEYRAEWIEEKKRGVGTHGDYDMAKTYSRFNRADLEKDKVCGCYFCKEIYPPPEISEWCCEYARGDEVTALCPRCGIDSVIGESSGYPITAPFFEKMHKYAFDGIACPVCGRECFADDDDYDVCDTCGWENDGVQRDDHDYHGGANWLSVNQAQANWEKHGKIMTEQDKQERAEFYRKHIASDGKWIP
jgi:hypothetical protein